MFRPPQKSALLCTYVGTGTQLICMAVVTMVFAVLGFLSPANRGGLMTAVLLLFVFMGVFAGYSAARLYKSFKVRIWLPIQSLPLQRPGPRPGQSSGTPNTRRICTRTKVAYG